MERTLFLGFLALMFCALAYAAVNGERSFAIGTAIAIPIVCVIQRRETRKRPLL